MFAKLATPCTFRCGKHVRTYVQSTLTIEVIFLDFSVSRPGKPPSLTIEYIFTISNRGSSRKAIRNRKGNWRAALELYGKRSLTWHCSKKIRSTTVFMCSFHLVMRSLHLSYALFHLVMLSFHSVMWLFHSVVRSFHLVMCSFHSVMCSFHYLFFLCVLFMRSFYALFVCALFTCSFYALFLCALCMRSFHALFFLCSFHALFVLALFMRSFYVLFVFALWLMLDQFPPLPVILIPPISSKCGISVRPFLFYTVPG